MQCVNKCIKHVFMSLLSLLVCFSLIPFYSSKQARLNPRLNASISIFIFPWSYPSWCIFIIVPFFPPWCKNHIFVLISPPSSSISTKGMHQLMTRSSTWVQTLALEFSIFDGHHRKLEQHYVYCTWDANWPIPIEGTWWYLLLYHSIGHITR